jgi:hypothetical protein
LRAVWWYYYLLQLSSFVRAESHGLSTRAWEDWDRPQRPKMRKKVQHLVDGTVDDRVRIAAVSITRDQTLGKQRVICHHPTPTAALRGERCERFSLPVMLLCHERHHSQASVGERTTVSSGKLQSPDTQVHFALGYHSVNPAAAWIGAFCSRQGRPMQRADRMIPEGTLFASILRHYCIAQS